MCAARLGTQEKSENNQITTLAPFMGNHTSTKTSRGLLVNGDSYCCQARTRALFALVALVKKDYTNAEREILEPAPAPNPSPTRNPSLNPEHKYHKSIP